MPAFENEDRKVVPRWHSSRRSVALREMLSTKTVQPTPVPRFSLEQKIMDWRQHRTLSFAADLISSAILVGGDSEVRTAAEAILAEEGDAFASARHIASGILGLRPASPEDVFDHAFISGARQNLRVYPRDALSWADLALAYNVLGHWAQAERAMRAALQLAPENRHILRSAARLLIHHDNYDRAHNILLRSSNLKNDPWLMSAEIVAASILGRHSRLVKNGRRMIESGSLAPFHVSELSSAIATLEMEAGRSKTASKLFSISLRDPTENAIAQAAWAQRTNHDVSCKELLSQVQRSHEAQWWTSMMRGQWSEALRQTEDWIRDEPFSSRPGVNGSYVASTVLFDYEMAVRIAMDVWESNKHNFRLLNNIAFAEAHLGHVESARRLFSGADVTALGEAERVVWLATQGLLSFRSGNSARGREYYRRAMEEAKKQQDLVRLAWAHLYLADEEYTAQTPEARDCACSALRVADRVLGSLPEMQPLVAKVRKTLG